MKSKKFILYTILSIGIHLNSFSQDSLGFKYVEYYPDNTSVIGVCKSGDLIPTDTLFYNEVYQVFDGEKYYFTSKIGFRKNKEVYSRIKNELMNEFQSITPPYSKLRKRMIVYFLIDKQGVIKDVYLGHMTPPSDLFYEFNSLIYQKALEFIGQSVYKESVKSKKNRILRVPLIR